MEALISTIAHVSSNANRFVFNPLHFAGRSAQVRPQAAPRQFVLPENVTLRPFNESTRIVVDFRCCESHEASCTGGWLYFQRLYSLTDLAVL
jgi:hypothetical protein